jgi:hypothetical protein
MRNKIILAAQLILFVSVGLCMIGCSKNKNSDDGYYYQDFDNLKMWDTTCQVTNELFHSGEFSTYTDSIHEFSQVFEMNITPTVIKKYGSVQVSAWCLKLSRDSKVKLIAAIESHGKAIVLESLDYSHALEVHHTWINLVLFLKFPETIPDGSKLKVYCWSPEKEKAFMDDVKIELRK